MNHVLANNALPLTIEIQGFCLMHEVGMLKGLTTHCSMIAHLCCCHFPYEFFSDLGTWPSVSISPCSYYRYYKSCKGIAVVMVSSLCLHSKN